MKYIPSIVVCALILCCPLVRANADSSANTQLLSQCKVPQADIDIIGKLSSDTQALITSWTTCSQATPFKASRAYYKQLKPNTKIPLPPAGWDTEFLTDDEFVKYADLIANAPW